MILIALSLNLSSQDKYDIITSKILQTFDSIKVNYTIVDGGMQFIRVIEAPGKNKNDLYVTLMESVTNVYKDSKSVIDVKDRELGLIIIKGIFMSATYSWGVSTTLQSEHILKIEIKDGKCRLTLTIPSIRTTIVNTTNHLTAYDSSAQITDFYPYWQECKPKRREDSFSKILLCYNKAMALITAFSDSIQHSKVDEW